jgi:hypothetical protein
MFGKKKKKLLRERKTRKRNKGKMRMGGKKSIPPPLRNHWRWRKTLTKEVEVPIKSFVLKLK